MSKTLIFAKKIWKNRPYRHSHAVTSFLVKCCVVQVGVEQGLFIGNLFYCPLYWTFIITLRYPQLLVFSLALKLNSLIHHMRHSESICWFGFGRFHFGYGSNLAPFLSLYFPHCTNEFSGYLVVVVLDKDIEDGNFEHYSKLFWIWNGNFNWASHWILFVHILPVNRC